MPLKADPAGSALDWSLSLDPPYLAGVESLKDAEIGALLPAAVVENGDWGPCWPACPVLSFDIPFDIPSRNFGHCTLRKMGSITSTHATREMGAKKQISLKTPASVFRQWNITTSEPVYGRGRCPVSASASGTADCITASVQRSPDAEPAEVGSHRIYAPLFLHYQVKCWESQVMKKSSARVIRLLGFDHVEGSWSRAKSV